MIRVICLFVLLNSTPAAWAQRAAVVPLDQIPPLHRVHVYRVGEDDRHHLVIGPAVTAGWTLVRGCD